jgi:hypothetical protein
VILLSASFDYVLRQVTSKDFIRTFQMVCQMTDIYMPPSASNNANSGIVNPNRSSGSAKGPKTLETFSEPTLSEDEIRLNRLGYKQVQCLVNCLRHQLAMIKPYATNPFHSLSESDALLQISC